MKVVSVLILALLFSNLSYSQYERLPNQLFYYWDHTPLKNVGGTDFPAYDEPNPDHFWTTTNPSTRTIKYSPTVMKTTDAYKGPYACLMRSTKFFLGIAAGSLMSGDYKGGMDPEKAVFFGKPWSGRPERFVGFYKYIPVDNDLWRSFVWLFNNKSGTRDTVGFAAFPEAMAKKTVTTYTKFDIPITYYNSDEPDSIVIMFTASADGKNFNGGDGSELYIDNIMLLHPGETSVNNSSKENAHFWVYPNPTTEKINFTIDPAFTDNSELSIFNAQGKLVRYEIIKNEFNEFNVQDLPNGYYSYQLKDDDALITKGKFLKN